MGELVGGMVITTFSGIAVITGTTLTAVGCGSGTDLCKAGLITLPIGLIGLVPGIWMMVDSKGTVHVTPMRPASPVSTPAASNEWGSMPLGERP